MHKIGQIAIYLSIFFFSQIQIKEFWTFELLYFDRWIVHLNSFGNIPENLSNMKTEKNLINKKYQCDTES